MYTKKQLRAQSCFWCCVQYFLYRVVLIFVIKVTVENAIRKLIPESICSADDVKEVVKSYAEVTKEQQRRVIEEAALAMSSKDVVESVFRQT